MPYLYEKGKTVAALATPLGEGGVAVIRISGNEALKVGNQIFSGNVLSYDTHTAHFGAVLDAKGKKVDQALLLVMKGPRSYTGEDTIEVQCHGGMVAARSVLEVVLQAGASAAGPGEFTFKAFMNGKIDLAQAEAVQRVVGARSSCAFEQASHHLEGGLSKTIRAFQKRLSEVAAIFEAWVDFPEEGLAFASHETLQAKLAHIIYEMKGLLQTFEEGKKIQEGISLCIVGAPNVGKSSLMNALLKKDRAIVTSQAGTTRDLLEETLILKGLSFRLIDTAGIRDTTEIVEKEGIRRAELAMKRADLVLFVLDATQEMNECERALFEKAHTNKTIFVWNKMDRVQQERFLLDVPHQVTLSAKELTGIQTLVRAIEKLIWTHGPPEKDEVLLSSVRHKEALLQSYEMAKKAHKDFIKGISPEFLIFDLRQSLSSLGKIIGTDVTEDILSEIFSKFCIGK